MWEKCAQYIKKIGTVILLSTIAIWFLGYYPRPEQAESEKVKAASERAQSTSLLDAMPSGSGLREAKTESEMVATAQAESGKQSFEQVADEATINGINENSFIAMLGHAVEPVLRPLGLNWRSSIALITSIPAKELVVSTLGVLYSSDSDESITMDLKKSGDFTPRSAAAFLVFILLFFPCIATISTIAHETGSKKWALFSIIYNTAVAWVAAFLVYVIGGMI
jgi:ferrous iron transport protein B